MQARTTTPTLGALPEELNDILTLHSSFLSALSLHYAHNGNATPVDLRLLVTSVSQIWSKRKVTIDDLRVCVGVLASGPTPEKNPFILSDYGYGKICVEVNGQYQTRGMISGPLNEAALQAMFMEGLEYLWKKWCEKSASARPIAQPKRRGRPRKNAQSSPVQITPIDPLADPSAIPTFLNSLPLAEVTPCASLAALEPLREKGRKRLRDLKDAGELQRSAKKSRESTGKENEVHAIGSNQQTQQRQVQSKMTDFTQVRKTNLLDRILAKQKAAELAPKPLSPAEQARQAALQRSEEILGVLSLLAASRGAGSRASFSLTALLQTLQSSVRSPISKEEAIKCVEVLANEVAPGYVNLVRMGSLCSVVVNQALRPMDVRRRLVELGVEF